MAGARRHGRRVAAAAATLLFAALAFAVRPAGADPCLDGVVDRFQGTNGGFGAESLPGIVLGPPLGGGQSSGSLDVVSLGNGGIITVEFQDNAVVDGPGDDLVIFENAFVVSGTGGQVFTEVGIVELSEDGTTFVTVPYDAGTLAGLAGRTPVYSRPDNAIDPRDPAAGGDRFDLASVGLERARFLRIVDPGTSIQDYGNQIPTQGPGKSGFDLDAAVALNSDELCAACCDVDDDGAVTPADVLLLVRLADGDAVAIDPCGAPSCGGERCGDADADDVLARADAARCLDLASELPADVQCPTGGGACDLPP